MIDHQEEWQVFDETGSPVVGESILPSESRGNSAVIVGAVHVWIWRRSEVGIEILLQHRAKDKPTWPDHLDISVAGHVDAGETLKEAVEREALEEVGAHVDSRRLEFIFSYRNFDNGIKWVYLLEQTDAVEYTFNDGEVQALQWVTMLSFDQMIKDPSSHNLVPHPAEYYSWLMTALHRVT